MGPDEPTNPKEEIIKSSPQEDPEEICGKNLLDQKIKVKICQKNPFKSCEKVCYFLEAKNLSLQRSRNFDQNSFQKKCKKTCYIFGT